MDRRERYQDIEEQLRAAMDARQATMQTSIPGIVTSVDLSKQTCSVQPSIQAKIQNQDGSFEDKTLPLLVDVLICFPKAGGFALTFPVAAGDEVLVHFASRAIDSWWQSGGIGTQADSRMHDLSDGIATLAPTSQPKKISNVSSQNVQLRNNSGDTLLEITPSGEIIIKATSKVTLESPQIDFKGAISHTGGALVSNGITFGTHKHIGVQTGSGTSGNPTN